MAAKVWSEDFNWKRLCGIASGKWESNIKGGRKEINNKIVIIDKTALFLGQSLP
jgi:hypothetical protein